MECGYKEIAEILGVSEITVRRRLKSLGVEGTLIDRQKGGKKRVFTEDDINRLKAGDLPHDRPINLPVPQSETGLSPVDHIGLSENDRAALEQVLHSFTLLPELKTLVEGLVAANHELRDQLTTVQTTEQQQAEVLVSIQKELHEAQQREDRYRAQVEETHRREEELRTELDQARQEALQQLKAIQTATEQREAQLKAQMDNIQQELARPWWQRLWRKR